MHLKRSPSVSARTERYSSLLAGDHHNISGLPEIAQYPSRFASRIKGIAQMECYLLAEFIPCGCGLSFDLHILKSSIFKFVVCNPCQSSPSLTILVPLWFIIIFLLFFYLS